MSNMSNNNDQVLKAKDILEKINSSTSEFFYESTLQVIDMRERITPNIPYDLGPNNRPRPM